MLSPSPLIGEGSGMRLRPILKKKGCGVDGKYAGGACKKMGFLDEPSEQARADGKKAGSACKKVAGLALQESMIFFMRILSFLMSLRHFCI